MGNVLVSVVMSVYNGERFLEESVDSILDQTFEAFEFIIIDDGSTDGSAALLQRFHRRDARVRVYHQENKGLVESLNRGISLARGKYIARMDADDISVRDRLIWQVVAMEKRPALGAIGGAIELIDWSGKVVGVHRFPPRNSEIRTKLFQGDCVLCHPATMIRSDVLMSCGGYRRVVVDAEDYDLWLRIAEHSELANLKVPILKYRRHVGQVSTQKFRRQALSNLAARAAGVSRRSQAIDPLDTVNEINSSVLNQLGQDDAAQCAVIARSYLTCIRSLIDGGEHKNAVSLMEEFLHSVEWALASNAIVADLYLLKAYLRWNENRAAKSLINALYALARRPIIIARPIKRLLFGFGVNLNFNGSATKLKMTIAMLARRF